MRDLTFFKEKVFPFNISSLMTVVMENHIKPAITENMDYYFMNNRVIRMLKAEGMTLDASQVAILQEFYYEMQGSKYLFLVKDHFYNYADHAFIAFGDGAQTEFTLLVDMDGVPCDHIYPYLDGLDIYIDNVLQPASAYDFADGQQLIFHSPPDLGAEVTASFHYDFIMRFDLEPLRLSPNVNGQTYNLFFNILL